MMKSGETLLNNHWLGNRGGSLSFLVGTISNVLVIVVSESEFFCSHLSLFVVSESEFFCRHLSLFVVSESETSLGTPESFSCVWFKDVFSGDLSESVFYLDTSPSLYWLNHAINSDCDEHS